MVETKLSFGDEKWNENHTYKSFKIYNKHYNNTPSVATHVIQPNMNDSKNTMTF